MDRGGRSVSRRAALSVRRLKSLPNVQAGEAVREESTFESAGFPPIRALKPRDVAVGEPLVDDIDLCWSHCAWPLASESASHSEFLNGDRGAQRAPAHIQ